TTATPFLREYEHLLLAFGTDYETVRHERIDGAAFAAFFGAGGYRSATLPNAQELDYDGLEARLLSSSYTPTAENPRRADMLRALRDLFDRHNVGGTVTIAYQTEMYWGQL